MHAISSMALKGLQRLDAIGWWPGSWYTEDLQLRSKALLSNSLACSFPRHSKDQLLQSQRRGETTPDGRRSQKLLSWFGVAVIGSE